MIYDLKTFTGEATCLDIATAAATTDVQVAAIIILVLVFDDFDDAFRRYPNPRLHHRIGLNRPRLKRGRKLLKVLVDEELGCKERLVYLVADERVHSFEAACHAFNSR